MEHTINVKKYDGTLEELANDVSNLQYDYLAKFLFALSKKIEKDSLADLERGREKLSYQLKDASESIMQGALDIASTWNICKKHIIRE